MSAEGRRAPVAVLGATGAVGQRFVSLLADHPLFELRELQASPRSAGRPYAEACDWLVPGRLPEAVAGLEVRPLGEELGATLVFSALDAKVAREAEESFAARGHFVCSNAGSWRMDPRVPLIVPEVNPDHLELLAAQTDWSGALVCNPNCSTIGLTLAVAPILQRFGLERLSVVTLQAISGAGTPSLRTLGMLANVVPHIRGEEEKMESEAFKILGRFAPAGGAAPARIEPASFDLTAQCNRVPVVDGHTLCVTVELGRDTTREELLDAWRSYSSLPQELGLPLAPSPPIVVHEDPDAPQPMLHRDAGRGMAVHVGRVRELNPRRWLFTTLSHNTVRGAAGGALLVAELAAATGKLGST